MFKSANVGQIDRIVRLIAGTLLIAAPIFFSGTLPVGPVFSWAIPLVGAILVMTALFRFCPLYRLVGINTCKVG